MSNAPYLLGRLMAALEAQDVITATVWQGKPIVLAAAIRAAGNKAQLAPILECLEPEAFDGKLDDEGESDFWLGYYHQKRELRIGGRVSGGRPEPEPVLDERWEVRIDDGLKQWTLANGGAELVRTLLREERARRN